MGVYIKGMKMPKDNQYIHVYIYPDGLVYYAVGECDESCKSSRAIEVPTPHGRLIDADVIDGRVSIREDGFKGETHDVLTQVRGLIATTPTVIDEENKGAGR